MQRTFWAGVGLSGIGLAGYLVGVEVAYPGRAWSVTAVMVGVTLAAVGTGGGDPE